MSQSVHKAVSNENMLMIGEKGTEKVFEVWPIGGSIAVQITEGDHSAGFNLTNEEVKYLQKWLLRALKTEPITS